MGKFDRVLIASDFDNTLVYTQGALDAGLPIPPMCERNRAAAKYFMDNGGFFAASTGRALPAFTDFAEDLGCNAPCVIANGAALYDFRTKQYLETAFIPDRIYGHMDVILGRFPDLALEVYHDDRRIHAMHPNQYIRNHEHLTRTPTDPVESFREIDLPIIKVLFEEDKLKLEELFTFIRSQPWSDEYELIYSGDHLLELTKHGATKGGMLLHLAELLGVAREDLYCIGDHRNDIPMLAVSAIPFAPDNCIPEVREFGARIVCHCRDGALADVVEILDGIYPRRETGK